MSSLLEAEVGRVKFVSLCLLFSLSAGAGAASLEAAPSRCPGDLGDTPLLSSETMGLVTYLHRTKRFDLRVLTSRVTNGRRKVVLLVGEMHVNHQEDIDAVERLRDTVDVHAYEASDTSATLGGRFYGFALYKVAPTLVALATGRRGGSTADEMQIEAIFNRMARDPEDRERLKDVAAEKGLWEMTEAERKAFVVTSYGGVKVTAEHVVRALDQARPQRETLNLERGHEITTVDHVASIAVPGALATLVAALCSYWVAPMLGYPKVGEAVVMVAAPVLTWAAIQLNTWKLPMSALVRGPALRAKLFPVYVSLIQKRNETMAGNIAGRLNEDPDEDLVMLADVGNLHTPGVLQILKETDTVEDVTEEVFADADRLSGKSIGPR